MQEFIVEVTTENAQQVLIEESNSRPVVIDFWADWCEPCKNLMPVLEKLANEYQGQFLLAKVNADDQQMIASQFGVRSLPTVMVMKDGQPIDGFAGAQTEPQVREMLEKHLPKPWDLQLGQAKALIMQGNIKEALPILQSAYKDSQQQANIAFALVTGLIASKRYDEAKEILDQVKMADQGPEYEQLRAQLELAQQAKKTPELEALEADHKAKPDDQEVAYQLAVQYSQNEYQKEALALLLDIVKKDLNFKDGEAKKTYRDILAVMGNGDPVAVEYQRKLYTLLY